MFNEGNQIHNLMSSSGSRTVINYGSGSDFLTSYGSGYGSGSTSQKVTVPTVPVPVPQHCPQVVMYWIRTLGLLYLIELGRVGKGANQVGTARVPIAFVLRSHRFKQEIMGKH